MYNIPVGIVGKSGDIVAVIDTRHLHDNGLDLDVVLTDHSFSLQKDTLSVFMVFESVVDDDTCVRYRIACMELPVVPEGSGHRIRFLEDHEFDMLSAFDAVPIFGEEHYQFTRRLERVPKLAW